MWWWSPDHCEEIPAIRRALDEFRREFEVTVFHWPCLYGGARVGTDWQAVVANLSDSLDSDTHLVTMGGSALALVALGTAGAEARSFATDGLTVPPATLEALDLPTMAEGSAALFQLESGYQFARLHMQGADEETLDSTARRLDSDIDLNALRRMLASYETLDLVAEAPRVDLPTLYLDPPLPLAASSGHEVRDIFLRFAPEASVGELIVWPNRLHEESCGRDLSRAVLQFLRKIRTRNQ